MKEMLDLLSANRFRLTRQQFKTIKGQILKGDIQGARKGLFTCLLRRV